MPHLQYHFCADYEPCIRGRLKQDNELKCQASTSQLTDNKETSKQITR